MYFYGESQNERYSAGCLNALQILSRNTVGINEDANQVLGSVPSDTLKLHVGPNETHQEEVDTLKYYGQRMLCQKKKKHQVLLVFCVFFCCKSGTEEPQLVGHSLCLPSLIQMHLVNKDDEL